MRRHILGARGPQNWSLAFRICCPARRRWQQFDRRPLVMQLNMRVDAHCEPNVGVPRQRLRRAGRDPDTLQAGDERMAVRMEIRKTPGIVAVGEVI
jgi:hypothetical protein